MLKLLVAELGTVARTPLLEFCVTGSGRAIPTRADKDVGRQQRL